jgi:alkanesulfonate monooxygenase SsuD/methylene tetrahydromethanopterin reductase-like flavin-dependent oxidoreductase (luciferase family)
MGGPFQFGLLMPMVGSRLSAAELIGELVDEVQVADRVGIDLALIPEHHQGPPGSLTDPIVTSSWMLAKTERIRIGPGVLLGPLHHSVRLAEQGAILHEASGGRVFFGIGAGYQPADFEIFGRDRETRRADLERTIIELQNAWNGASGTVGHQVLPLLTRAAPEIWMGAWSRWGVRTAARLADGWLV